MALLDLRRLVSIYNLHHHDAQFQSERSDPVMPTPNPPRTADRPPLPQVPDHAAPKTLQSEYTRPQSSTPTSSGTSASYTQESDIDQFDGYNFEEYDEHIRADLGHRVFVDFEVFLKRVLHVPENWREKWGQAIEAVKANKEFNDYHKKYRDLCNKKGGHDAAFYDPLTQMVNSVLEAVTSSRYGDILPERHQYYRVNNPGHPPAEVINKVGPSPDQVLLDKDRAGPYFKAPLDWANPLQVFEVKPYDNAILDGRGIPRLIVGGKRTRQYFHDQPRLTTGQELTHLETMRRPPKGANTEHHQLLRRR